MSDSGDPSFHALLFQWSARASAIAFEMVLLAVAGIGLDRLCGTVVLFAILGVVLGMALGFWQLLKFAQGETTPSGVDKHPETRDNSNV
jgi:F0F1-type ATP synthase assembly protein I